MLLLFFPHSFPIWSASNSQVCGRRGAGASDWLLGPLLTEGGTCDQQAAIVLRNDGGEEPVCLPLRLALRPPSRKRTSRTLAYVRGLYEGRSLSRSRCRRRSQDGSCEMDTHTHTHAVVKVTNLAC